MISQIANIIDISGVQKFRRLFASADCVVNCFTSSYDGGGTGCHRKERVTVNTWYNMFLPIKCLPEINQ